MTDNERKYLLLPERLFTPGVFLASLSWLLMLHLVDYESNRGIAPVYQRVIVQVLIHFVPFLVAGVTYLACRQALTSKYLVPAMVVSIVLGAALRGYFQFTLLNLISDRVLNDVSFRVAASTTNTTFAFLISWAGMSGVDLHRRRRKRLLEDSQRLELLRQESRQRLELMDSAAAEEIRSSLLSSLESVSSGDSVELTASMRRLIDDVVRPMSQYFERESAEWFPPEAPKSEVRIDWRNVLSNAFRMENIFIAPLAVMLIWTSLPNAFFIRGPLVAVAAVIHCFACFPLFGAIKRIGGQLAEDRSTLQQAVLFFLALYLGGQILGLTAWVYTRFQEPKFFYAVMAPFFTVIGGSLIALARSALKQSELLEEELTQTGNELRWSLARSREMHRQQRRALAHALHGQVQAAVASSILRLELSSKNEYNPNLAGEIVNSLKTRISEVDLLSNSSVPLKVVLDRIITTWRGIAKITWKVEPSVAERLSQDSTCAIALNDVLTELTYNSIKHGSATKVIIELDVNMDRTLSVSVVDNGKPAADVSRRGLGSALLDDCATSWERKRVDGHTRTQVLLPLI